MVYHFVLINAKLRTLVEGLVAHFDHKHFEEVWRLRHYTSDEFKRNFLNIFEEPDLTQARSLELFEKKEGNAETLDDFMKGVEFLVTISFPKLDLQNRESIAVTAFWKGLVDQDAAKLAAVQSEGKVAKAMKIAASVTALSCDAPCSPVASAAIQCKKQSLPHFRSEGPRGRRAIRRGKG